MSVASGPDVPRYVAFLFPLVIVGAHFVFAPPHFGSSIIAAPPPPPRVHRHR
jgi:hypothetical protein